MKVILQAESSLWDLCLENMHNSFCFCLHNRDTQNKNKQEQSKPLDALPCLELGSKRRSRRENLPATVWRNGSVGKKERAAKPGDLNYNPQDPGSGRRELAPTGFLLTSTLSKACACPPPKFFWKVCSTLVINVRSACRKAVGG